MAYLSRIFRRTSSRSHRRWLATANSSNSPLRHLPDPGKLVTGLTYETINSSPNVREYMEANFPDSFKEDGEDDEGNLSGEQAAINDSFARVDNAAYTHYPRNIRPISCYTRTKEGSRCSTYLRRNNLIPGILYGSDPTKGILSNQPLSKLVVQTQSRELQRELDRYHHHFESRVYNLTVYEHPEATEGTVHCVMPKNLQRHPVHGAQIYCVNYLRYHAGRPIKLPIAYINEEESPALKRDGFIVPIQRYIECFVDAGVDIPEKLELECTGLKVKEVIRLDRLILPEGVRYSDRVIKHGDEFILGVVFGRRRDAGDADADAA
ncbi:hypothetical protein MPSEU_000656100 [Mayamaea pseudoterrestris]|nr:hypothetical protein MPSEU_000656100 [Mayamaea pseudoterrestris]